MNWVNDVAFPISTTIFLAYLLYRVLGWLAGKHVEALESVAKCHAALAEHVKAEITLIRQSIEAIPCSARAAIEDQKDECPQHQENVR